MSSMASQFTDRTLPTVLGEVDSVDGVPFGKKLTKGKLHEAGDALQEFSRVVREEPRDADGSKPKAGNGSKPKDADGAKPRDADGSKPKDADGSKPPPAGPHCFVVTGGLGFSNSDRTGSTEEDVRNACYNYFQSYPVEPSETTINMIVDSGGGSLDSAFKTVLILRRFAKRIRVYVPRRAKSAATLIAIGVDEILMSPFAELGPLDTQIKDPRNPTKTVSALDCYQSVDYVQKFGLETLPKVLGVLVRETEARIPLADLITIATDFALDEVTPIIGQVNAVDFGGWGRTLKIGETYACALQKRRGYVDEKKAEKLARTLVYDYPHHPYYIDCEEARRIGLPVNLMTQDEYEASLKVVEACEGGRCIGFLENVQEMAKKAPVDELLSMNGNGSLHAQDPANAIDCGDTFPRGLKEQSTSGI